MAKNIKWRSEESHLAKTQKAKDNQAKGHKQRHKEKLKTGKI